MHAVLICMPASSFLTARHAIGRKPWPMSASYSVSQHEQGLAVPWCAAAVMCSARAAERAAVILCAYLPMFMLSPTTASSRRMYMVEPR